MKLPTLKIENEYFNDAKNNILTCINPLSKKETAENINKLLPSFKSGYGSSHVWISDKENNRIAIIYF